MGALGQIMIGEWNIKFQLYFSVFKEVDPRVLMIKMVKMTARNYNCSHVAATVLQYRVPQWSWCCYQYPPTLFDQHITPLSYHQDDLVREKVCRDCAHQNWHIGWYGWGGWNEGSGSNRISNCERQGWVEQMRQDQDGISGDKEEEAQGLQKNELAEVIQ